MHGLKMMVVGATNDMRTGGARAHTHTHTLTHSLNIGAPKYTK